MLYAQKKYRNFQQNKIFIAVILLCFLEYSLCNFTGVHYLPPQVFRHHFRKGTRVRIRTHSTVWMYPLNSNYYYDQYIRGLTSQLRNKGVILDQEGTYQFRVYPSQIPSQFEGHYSYQVQVYNDDGNFRHRKSIPPSGKWSNNSNSLVFRVKSKPDNQHCLFKVNYKAYDVKNDGLYLLFYDQHRRHNNISDHQIQFEISDFYYVGRPNENRIITIESDYSFKSQRLTAKQYHYELSSPNCELDYLLQNHQMTIIGPQREQNDNEESDDDFNILPAILGTVFAIIGFFALCVMLFFIIRKFRRKRRQRQQKQNFRDRPNINTSDNFFPGFGRSSQYLGQNHKDNNIGQNNAKRTFNTQYANIQNQKQQQQGNKVDCSICLYGNCDTVLKCTHRFHKKCIQDWKSRNKQCPNCRKEIAFK